MENTRKVCQPTIPQDLGPLTVFPFPLPPVMDNLLLLPGRLPLDQIDQMQSEVLPFINVDII